MGNVVAVGIAAALGVLTMVEVHALFGVAMQTLRTAIGG